MSVLRLAWLDVLARRKRIVVLLLFAGLFLAAGVAARLLVSDEHGHVNADHLFLVGGYPLVSALLLMGWVLGRFPLIATLVLMAGLFSDDHARGHARLLAVRPTSLVRLYGTRFAVLGAVAFGISAVLLPAFDLLLLGTWAGPATLVLILSQVLVFGGLTALLSVWTRGDAWITLLLAVGALVWDALLRADALLVPPGVRDVVGFVLPPQAMLFELEGAFAEIQPIPWEAFTFVAGYGLVMLVLAAFSLTQREL